MSKRDKQRVQPMVAEPLTSMAAAETVDPLAPTGCPQCHGIGQHAAGCWMAAVSIVKETPRPELLTVQIDPLWQERLRAMAKSAGVEPGHYLEMLLRRAYTSLPLSKRGGQ